MSKDHDYPSSQDDKERSESIARALVIVENNGGSKTDFAEKATASGHDIQDSEDDNATQHESQTSVGPGAGSDEENQQERAELEALERLSTRTPVHSVFSKRKKLFIVFMTAWGGLFSPISANIYFAALNPLARALNVSDSLINLTLTSYMIFQGLAPSIFGDLSDEGGRRPAFIISLSIYLFANIGLALQKNYAALMVLRCIQSFGSSATIALAQGIVADIATSAERGTYVGYVITPLMFGQSIGPCIGGILSEFLGWRAIFWFLVIFVVAFLIPYIILVPETSRKVVGNGSIPPHGWNMSLLGYLEQRRLAKEAAAQENEGGNALAQVTSREQQRLAREAIARKRKLRWPNPFSTVHIVLQKENGAVLLYNSIIFIAFIDIVASIPSMFSNNYNFNDLQIGLCYLPFGAGSASSTFINGKIMDWNFRRVARKHGFPVDKKRQADLRHFPIEKARLQLAVPMLWTGAFVLLIYGWLLQKRVHFAGPLVILYFLGYFITGSFNVLATLLVDLNLESPATATAANNLVRCLMGSGATAVIVPMINGIGEGWTFTMHTIFLLATSPAMFAVMKWGPIWREEKEQKQQDAKEAKEAEQVENETLQMQQEKGNAAKTADNKETQ